MIKPRTGKTDAIAEMKDINSKRLIVISREYKREYYFIANNRLVSFYVQNKAAINVGDIYIGLIDHVNKGTDGYFVNVKKGLSVYAPGENKKTPVLLNRSYKGRLSEGDQVLIEIKKEAYREKRAKGRLLTLEDTAPDLIGHAKGLTLYSRVLEGEALQYLLERLAKEENVKCVCSDEEAFTYMTGKYSQYFSDIALYKNDTISINALYNLEGLLKRVTDKKVWLKSGGYLYIEQTEAMNVIDVNTGKSDGKSRDANLLAINLEAAEEIAYQLGARNLSGVIMVDFINMKNENDYSLLKDCLCTYLKELSPAGNFIDVTKLGMVEITREKKYCDIYEMLQK